jgi:hypothetical protein
MNFVLGVVRGQLAAPRSAKASVEENTYGNIEQSYRHR